MFPPVVCLEDYYSILLLLSCFMRIGAWLSSDLLLSCSLVALVALALHNTIMLIITHKSLSFNHTLNQLILNQPILNQPINPLIQVPKKDGCPAISEDTLLSLWYVPQPMQAVPKHSRRGERRIG